MKKLITIICAAISAICLCHSNSASPTASLRQEDATTTVSSIVNRLDSLNRILALENKRNTCYGNGQEYASIKYTKRICDLKKQYFGELSDEYLLELLNLSDLYTERLRARKSYEIHEQAYEPYMQKLRKDFGALGLDERQVYWMEASKYIRKTLDIAYKTATKFRVSDASLMAGAAYNATLLYKGILLNLSNTTGINDIPQLRITWKDVRDRLEPDDLAIEFFRTDNGKYGAILLRKEWKSPKLIRLPELKKVSSDKVLADVSKCMSNPDDEDAGILNSASGIVWPDRIIQYFPADGKGNVYFSSDGLLLQTGIEYLPFNKANAAYDYYTISDVYNLVRLSSTRELVCGKGSKKLETAALYGGINYSVPAEIVASAPRKSRGAIQDELPGTYEEVMAIQEKFATNGIKVRLKTESDANLQSFINMGDGKYNIVHIATHGLYWSKELKPDIADPLERCGLLFSDGLATAKEISRVNLDNSDLVVLSACNTALGDMSQDGVFGLQRGFKMAGAGAMLMSLWEVDDVVTKELMTNFYSNLLLPGQSNRAAFNQAVASIRQKYQNPYYWAAFILMD